MSDYKILDFCKLLEKEQAEAQLKAYPTLPTEKVKFTMRKKYACVDVGNSGKYMIDLETEEIFGIKGYGVIHRGHRYGTLDSIHDWDWSGYTARPKMSNAKRILDNIQNT